MLPFASYIAAHFQPQSLGLGCVVECYAVVQAGFACTKYVWWIVM